MHIKFMSGWSIYFSTWTGHS